MSTRVHLQKWRLSDAMDYQLHQLSYPIEIPLCASPALWSPSKTFPEIGKVFFGLENRYGPSSKRFDWYKQSFCFPFLVRASVGGEEIHFHMSIMDWKGALDFRFRQMQERSEDFDKKRDLISPSCRIADMDFEYMVGYFRGFIEGFVGLLCEHKQPPQPFFRSVPAALTVYGFDGHRFFCNNFGGSDEFDALVAELKLGFPSKAHATLEPHQQVANTKHWIEQAKLASTSSAIQPDWTRLRLPACC